MDSPIMNLPKSIKLTIAILVVVFLAALSVDRIFQAGMNYKSYAGWQQPMNTSDTITVTGTGKVTAVPDVALISLAVESRGETTAKVLDDNSSKMKDIKDFLRGLGVDSKDIRSTQYALNPNYRWEPNTGKQLVDGYVLNETIELNVRKLDTTGKDMVDKILGGAITRGVNQIGQVSFAFDDPEKLTQEARLDAIAKAKEKAQSLASAAGVKLGKVRTFSESYGDSMPIPMMDMAKSMGGGGMSPDIQVGSSDIVVAISMNYEIAN